MKDLAGLYRFLGEARQAVTQTHTLHVGDLCWQVFHMLAAYNPPDLIRLWEDEQGLLGFALAYPPFGMLDVQVKPEARSAELEAEMFGWALKQITALNPRDDFYTLVNEHDRMRIALLEANHFQNMGDWCYMQCGLEDISAPQVAQGFRLTDMTQVGAAARAEALALAFGAPVFPERYEAFLRAPGYDPQLDVVAVNSGGEVAAFALCWAYPVSKDGQFEPVGSAPAFQRQGLGKAVLLEGMRRLRERGMERVIVIVDAGEEPAFQLYRSVGMETRWKLHLYGKISVG